ncbi:MAG TPA: DMT family transporter [Limnobacter sp.]|nr:DMT family transporter [Limnobacter sp.]
MRQSPLLRNTALALVFVVIWTSAFPAAKLGLLDSPPLLFLAIRFLIAGALILMWAHLQSRALRLGNRDLAVLVILGLLNHALYLGLSWTGMTQLSSGLSTIIISANPILVAVLSSWLLKESLTLRKMSGMMLGFLGVAYIVRNRLGGALDTELGILLVVCALFTIALGTVLYKRWPVQLDVVTATGYQILFSGVLLLPIAVWMEDFDQINLSLRFLSALVWLVFVVSIAGYQLWFNMLERGSASAASVWMFLCPPLGLLAGAWLLAEPLHWVDFLGILPVILGIVLVTVAHHKKSGP